MSNPLETVGKIVEGVERGAAILRVLAPLAHEVDQFLDGGAEPAIFQEMPELRSVAVLERARIAARSNV